MSVGRLGRPPIPPGGRGDINPKKSGSGWVCRVRYRDLSNVKHEFTAGGATKQECLNVAATRWVEITTAMSQQDGRSETSMRFIADEWLRYIQDQIALGRLAPGTLVQYRSCWNGTLGPLLDDLDVNELTRYFVQDLLYKGLFRRNQRGDYVRDPDGQLIPLVGPQPRQVLGAVLDFAADRGYRRDGLSPLYGTKRPPKAPRAARSERVLNDAEWDQLLAMARTAALRPRAANHLYRILAIMYFTGARISEAVGLTVDKIDLDSVPGTVIIDEKLPEAYRISDAHPLEPTKQHDRRIIIAVPELREILAEILEATQFTRVGDPLVATRNGTFVTHANLRTMLRALVKGTDLDWVHPHALRRTYLTAADKVYGPKAAAQLAGHSDERTTLRHYVIRDGLVLLDPRPIFATAG